MKKALLLIIIVSIFAACGDTMQTGSEPTIISKLTINELPNDLQPGMTHQLSITTEPASSITPQWSSSNTDVASISSTGLLTVKSGGITDITATHELLQDTKNLIINEYQDYTSFIFYHNIEANDTRSNDEVDMTLNNCVIGYLKSDNLYYKLVELGSLSKGNYSDEVRVTDDSVSEIHFFCDIQSDGQPLTIRLLEPFVLLKNKKNIFELETGLLMKYAYKDDPTTYPQ